MVKVKINTDEFYIDGILQQNLETAKDIIVKDWDMLFIVDGSEGTGKSVLAMQMAYYCDPTLELDRIVFTSNEFKKAILSAKPYQAVIYDEAYTGLSARATMSLINKTLVSMLAEIRQRNLFVFIVMPTFFDLDKYVALWRSRALLHVYTGDKFERGYFMFFNKTRKKDLYIQGKKFYNYFKPEANFKGRFTNFYPVDEAEYKKKKRESLTEREKKSEEHQIRTEIQNAIFQRMMELNEDVLSKISIDIRCQIIGISKPTYYVKLEKWKDDKLLTNI